MRAGTLAIASVATTGLVLAAAWAFRWPLEKAALLAPVVVLTAGATAFLGVLWAKVVVEGLRRSRHPVAIVGGVLGAFALLVVLSFFVELPDYGGH